MPTEPGTFERVAILLGEALQPLADRLHPDRFGGFVGELGLEIPAGLLSPQLQTALGSAVNAATELPPLVGALTASIEADADELEIIAAAAEVVAKVIITIDALVTVGTELDNLPPISGVTATEMADFAAELPGRLLELMVIDYVETRAHTVAAILTLLGLIEHTRVNVGSTEPFKPEVTRRALRLDRLGAFVESPEAVLLELYGWGDATFDAELLLSRLHRVLAGLRVPAAYSYVGEPPRPLLELFLAAITPTTGPGTPGLEAKLVLALTDGLSFPFPLGKGVDVTLAARGNVAASAGMEIRPPAEVTVIPPSGSVQAEVSITIAKAAVPPATAIQLLGLPGGSRLEAERLSFGVRSTFAAETSGPASGDFGIDGRVEGGKLVISLGGADGFVGSLVGGGAGMEAQFDLGFGWSAGAGVYFTGSGALEIQLPTHIQLGPIEIEAITVSAGVDGASVPLELTANIKGLLGPLAVVVEQIGAQATLSFPPGGTGNLQVANLEGAFKPPNGVGMALDVGVVKGGGYLRIDHERGEYAGALELEIAEVIAVAAIGLITTRNPDGSPGFSLLLIITADFGTGIQLGYGFTLMAVGGLVGLNRRMHLPALVEGVRSGAIESVMFPRDVVANAPQIISDLRTFFPAQQDKFLIGPMIKLGWMTPTLISVSVGVIIEIPGNIAIVGVLKVVLPTEDAPVLRLQVNFVGAIEFDKKRLYFFASIYESRVLFITLEGDMGLLVAWGDDANFVVTVGGFHPRFTPPPLPFPSPRRIAASLINTSVARVRIEGYFAVTSNTAQFGAAVELFFGFSGFSVEGHMGLDALFQFSPFSFIVEISASVSLKVGGMGLFSIRLELVLSGPTPWRARGSGYLSLWFFEISADFDVTWGEAQDTQLEPVDVFPLLVEELRKATSWEARLPAGTNLLVALREHDPAGDLVLHPVGSLLVRQRVVPLDLTIDKVGNRRARDVRRVGIQQAAGGGLTPRDDVNEPFAIAQFQEMDDATKLSRPAFQPLKAGLELSVEGAATTSAKLVRRTLRYEEIVIDNRFRRRVARFRALFAPLFVHLIAGNSVSLSALSVHEQKLSRPFDDKIAVAGDAFVIASTATNAIAAATDAFGSEASAHDSLASLLADDPNLAGTLHVIPAAEMVGAA